MAQFGSASALGAEGRGFKSRYPDGAKAREIKEKDFSGFSLPCAHKLVFTLMDDN